MDKKFTVLIVIILLIVAGYLIINNRGNEQNEVVNLETENKECTGKIEGSFYGWSEVLPEGLYVCAQDMNTQYYYCTDKSVTDEDRFRFGKGYEIDLPAGSYRVAALAPSDLIVPEKFREIKSTADDCNANDEYCLTTLKTVEVICGKNSQADLNSRGELDLFKIFDLKQYPNYIE